MVRGTLYVIAALSMATSLGWAGAPALDWNVSFTRTHGGADPYYDSVTLSSGITCFLTERDNSYVLAKVSAAGGQLGETTLDDAAGPPEWRALAVGPSGSVYVAGRSWSGSTNIAIAKYSSSGSLLWAKDYDSPGNKNEWANDVAVDAAGNILVAGEYEPSPGASDALLAKFSPAGVFQWSRNIDHGDDDYGYAVATNAAGDAYLTGPSKMPALSKQYMFVAKYDSGGAEQWSRTYTRTGWDYSRAIVFWPANAYVYVGWEGSNLSGDFIGALKVNSLNGNLDDFGIYSAFGGWFVTGGIALDSLSNVYVSGSVCCDWRGFDDFFTVSFNPALDTVNPGWPVRHNTGSSEGGGYPIAGARVSVDGSDAIYFSGPVSPKACGLFSDDLLVRKYAANGSVTWTVACDRPVDGVEVEGIAADGSGFIYTGADLGPDPAMLKHVSGGGVLSWPRYYGSDAYHCSLWCGGMAYGNGAAHLAVSGYNSLWNRNDIVVPRYDAAGNLSAAFNYAGVENLVAGPVVVDDTGNVYLAASFYNVGTTLYDLAIARLSSFGAVVWSRTLSFAVDDDPVAVGLDALNKSLYVLEAYPAQTGEVSRYGILKFSSIDGVLQWTRTIPAARLTEAIPGGLAVHGSDVFVCGYEQNDLAAPTESEGRIFKLDASGTLLLSSTIAGSPHARFRDVSVGSGGHIYVTGSTGTAGAPGTWDLLTASLDAGGNFRWSDSFDSGAPDDTGWGVAAGSIHVAGSGGQDVHLLKYSESAATAAVLVSSLAVTPPTVEVGRWCEIVLSVTNTGNMNAADVTPGLTVDPGASLLDYVDGPTPATFAVLAPSGSGHFTWTYSISGDGTIGLTGQASGFDSGSGDTISTIASVLLTDLAPAVLARAFSVETPSRPARQGDVLKVILTVSNTGEAAAVNLAPGSCAVGGDSSVVRLLSAPSPAPVALPGQGAVTFAWTYEALDSGQVSFAASAAGVDSLWGTALAVNGSSHSIVIRKAFEKELVVFPNPVNRDRMTVAVRLEGDAREFVVDVYNAAMRRAFTGTWENVTRADGQVEIAGVSGWAPGVYLLRVKAHLEVGRTQFAGPVTVVVKR